MCYMVSAYWYHDLCQVVSVMSSSVKMNCEDVSETQVNLVGREGCWYWSGDSHQRSQERSLKVHSYRSTDHRMIHCHGMWTRCSPSRSLCMGL